MLHLLVDSTHFHEEIRCRTLFPGFRKEIRKKYYLYILNATALNDLNNRIK